MVKNYNLKDYKSFDEFLSEFTADACGFLMTKKVSSDAYGIGEITEVSRITTSEEAFDEFTEISEITLVATVKFGDKVGQFHLSRLKDLPEVYTELMEAFKIVAKQRAKECKAIAAKEAEERKAREEEDKAAMKAKEEERKKSIKRRPVEEDEDEE